MGITHRATLIMGKKMQTELSFSQELKRLGAIGILTTTDLMELGAGTQRVFDLMQDGGWYTSDQIEIAAGENGIPAREGLRRMRELRRAGVEIEKERMPGTRQWKYRIKS